MIDREHRRYISYNPIDKVVSRKNGRRRDEQKHQPVGIVEQHVIYRESRDLASNSALTGISAVRAREHLSTLDDSSAPDVE